MTTERSARRCPRCGSAEAVPILYGMPTGDAFEAAERGEIALGGCVVGEEAPELLCRGCGVPLPWAAELPRGSRAR